MPAGSKVAPPAQSSSTVSARSSTPGLSVGTRSVYCVSSKLVAAFASAPMLRPSDAEKFVDPLSGEVPCALELHVLDEVREAALVLVFEHRPRLHDQPQFGLFRGLAVRADVEAQAVGQAADEHLRIDRHLLRKGIGSDRCRRRLAAGGSLGRGQRHSDGQQAGGQHADDGAPTELNSHIEILMEPRTSGQQARF